MTIRLLFILAACLLGPARALAAPDGALLYEQHCAVCHGESGTGGVGVPLALPAFIDTVDDDYLRATIRHGRPGRIMPAFATLSDAQIDAVVDHLRSWGTRPAPHRRTAAVLGDPVRGAELYRTHCAECHGANGEGGQGTGVTFSRPRDLPIMPPALNNAGFLASATDEMIQQTLRHGRLGTPMKSFLDAGLSARDIDDLVSHVRGFAARDVSSFGTEVPADLGEDQATLTVESPYSLEETVEAVERAVVGLNFKHIRTQFVEQGLVPEGEENPRQVIVYFCNFNFLNEALQIDPRVGMFLPCRVTVHEQAGKVWLTAINPLRLSKLFNNDELEAACIEMHKIYVELLDNATL